ncbi:MAG: hypothetical protein ACK5RL_08980 [Acidimicrobiales bacterium]
MGIRLTKPWIEWSPDRMAAIPAQLGVFELAGPDDSARYVGYGGGLDRFGLRSAIADAVTARPELGITAFRYEITHAYRSRHAELLMVHLADSGKVPIGNAGDSGPVGRLRPGSSGRTGRIA